MSKQDRLYLITFAATLLGGGAGIGLGVWLIQIGVI